MATLEQRFKWLKECLSSADSTYSEIIRDDISNYLQIDYINPSFLRNSLNKKFDLFQTCQSRNDVELFVSHIVTHVIMKSQNEELIADYLATESDDSLRVIYVKAD